ncbi:MAG TPA: hypothetical protein VF806_06135 [Anaerolineaceae bacterium]
MLRISHLQLLGSEQAEPEDEKEPRFSFPLLALLFVLLMLLLMNVGCAPVGGPPKDSTVKSGTVLFADDFSKTPDGWGNWSRDGSKVDYAEGGLRILVDENQFDFWSVSGHKFGDVQIEVDALKRSGPDDNDYGIICRYLNKDNFYMLVVSSDGYYGIARMKSGQYSMIGSDKLQYSQAISQGNVTNHLRADCVGSKLSLYANGQKLMEASDTNFVSGDAGVLAGSYNGKGVEVIFDNFVVKKP